MRTPVVPAGPCDPTGTGDLSSGELLRVGASQHLPAHWTEIDRRIFPAGTA